MLIVEPDRTVRDNAVDARMGEPDVLQLGTEEQHSRHEFGERGEDYALHSDGVVCRCAVVWRREAIARGLAEKSK